MKLSILSFTCLLVCATVLSIPLPSHQPGDIVNYMTPMLDGSKKRHPAVILDVTPNKDGILHHTIAETSHRLPQTKRYRHKKQESIYHINKKDGQIAMTPEKDVLSSELSYRHGEKVSPEHMKKLREDIEKCKNNQCDCPSTPQASSSRQCITPAGNRIQAAKKADRVRQKIKNNKQLPHKPNNPRNRPPGKKGSKK